VLGLRALAKQVAVGVDDPARLAGGAGGEDDQGRVLRVHLLDRGWRLLRAVLVERLHDFRQGHRRHLVGQLVQESLLANAQRRRCRARPQLEIVTPQLGAAGQRHGAHAPAGEQREHPLGPVAGQRHHHVAAAHAAGGEGAREARGAGDQLAEVPVPALALGVDRDDPQPRGGGSLHNVLDEVHGRGRIMAARDL
jgi:hypothetical protein